MRGPRFGGGRGEKGVHQCASKIAKIALLIPDSVTSGVWQAEAVQPMAQAQEGMFPKHTRSGVAHDAADLVAAVALVAMDRAPGAGGLFRAEAAALQSQAGVGQELPALRAETGTRIMVVAAIDAHQGAHRLPFAREAA